MSYRIGFIPCFVAALLVFAPVTSIAQNVIINGEFHSNLAGWGFPSGTPTWSPLDVDNSQTSGSVHLTHPGGSARACMLRQCVPVPSGGPLLLSAWAYTPSGQGFDGLILSFAARHNAPNCTGGAFAAGGKYLPSEGDWTHHVLSISVYQSPLPPNTTIEVQVCIDPAPQAGFNGYVDNIRLEPGITLFMHGFE